jgi:hypothetical protein
MSKVYSQNIYSQKKFTAEEVTLIVAMLGEPPYREETLSYPP